MNFRIESHKVHRPLLRCRYCSMMSDEGFCCISVLFVSIVFVVFTHLLSEESIGSIQSPLTPAVEPPMQCFGWLPLAELSRFFSAPGNDRFLFSLLRFLDSIITTTTTRILCFLKSDSWGLSLGHIALYHRQEWAILPPVERNKPKRLSSQIPLKVQWS